MENHGGGPFLLVYNTNRHPDPANTTEMWVFEILFILNFFLYDILVDFFTHLVELAVVMTRGLTSTQTCYSSEIKDTNLKVYSIKSTSIRPKTYLSKSKKVQL